MGQSTIGDGGTGLPSADQIETTLDQVRRGALTAAEATESLFREAMLLSQNPPERHDGGSNRPSTPHPQPVVAPSPPFPTETFDDLTKRLGPPPPELIQLLSQRFPQRLPDDSNEGEAGGGWDHLCDLRLSREGEVFGPGPSTPSDVDTANSLTFADSQSLVVETADDEPTRSSRSRHAKPRIRSPPLWVLLAIAVAIVALLAWNTIRPNRVPLPKKGPLAAGDGHPLNHGEAFSHSPSSPQPMSDRPDELIPGLPSPEAIDNSSPTEKETDFGAASLALLPIPLPDQVTDDSPLGTTSGPLLSSSVALNPRSPGTASQLTRPTPIDDVPESNEAFSGEPPAGVPQPTQTLPKNAVSLPDRSSTGETVLIGEGTASQLSLEFPTQTPLTLASQVAATDLSSPNEIQQGDREPDKLLRWEIIDQRKDLVIAQLTSGSRGTSFSWTGDAAVSNVATQLVNGRLRDGSGNVTYFRPTVHTNPWRLRIDQADVRLTWELRGPIIASVTEVDLRLELPQELEVGWIDPLAPEESRRGEALAIIRAVDDEQVGVAMRFDLRCGRELSCRLRFAGRLDDTLPWQLICHSDLADFVDALDRRDVAFATEKERLSDVYQFAGTEGRRVLRIKQQNLAHQSERLAELSRRAASLQRIVALLESEASIELNLGVRWNGQTQPILEMEPTESRTAERSNPADNEANDADALP